MKKELKVIYSIVGLGILILGLLIWRFPYVLSSNDNVGQMIFCIALLCALIPAGIHHFGDRPTLKYAVTWMGIFFVLLLGYSFQDEWSGVAERVKRNILPTHATSNADGSVSFLRAKGGSFIVEASVNSIPVSFMVDTGASKVVLTLADAKRLGIDVESLSFNEPMQTANGISFGSPIRLAEIKVGTLILRDVTASVSQNLTHPSLLGMSFLKKLKRFKIEGDHLVLEGTTP
ncbi:MAG: TIGR02281 family clan AA aspartic protease [Alphaproteobacteria bacterium]|nr:TIGR02281 family clan AA aspartic protease [Alphaproteobacteria bacterium]